MAKVIDGVKVYTVSEIVPGLVLSSPTSTLAYVKWWCVEFDAHYHVGNPDDLAEVVTSAVARGKSVAVAAELSL